MSQERISSIERLLLFKELLDSALRHSSHPAHLHEMECRLESAELEAMNNIGYHCWRALLYFDQEFVRIARRRFLSQMNPDLFPVFPQSGSPYVWADEQFLD
jgi:hypothetical protein